MKTSFLSLSFCGAMLLGCASSDPGGESDGLDTDHNEARPTDGGTKSDAGKRDSGGSSSGGKKDAASGGNNNDDNSGLCESRNINARSQPPDVLIVLDRSYSMILGGRWDPTIAALKRFTEQFDDQVQFGLEMFPLAGGGPTDICTAGKVDIQVAPKNAGAINTFAAANPPILVTGTPTGESLAPALEALGDRTVAADTKPIPAYVVLLTDGEPMCQQPANQLAIDGVTALMNAGIKTYVVGYNVAGGAQLMNQMAQAGGTDKYFAVENEQDLNDAFSAITASLVQCSFELDEVPSDPSFVRVTIDGETVVFDANDGWKIDGKTVSLQDDKCNLLRDGTDHLLKVAVECKPIIYL